MAYDERVAERVRESLGAKAPFSEKKMFGGLALMVRGNMCLGVLGDAVMARIGPERYAEMLAREHVREMDFTGRPMNGYVFVDPPGFEADADLEFVVDCCLAFNAGLPAK